MKVSSQTLKDASTGFKALWLAGMEGTTPHYVDFCDVYASTNALEEYIFPTAPPQMRKWSGERQVSTMKAFELSLRNDKFEATIGVSRESFEDDKLGMYSNQFRQLGARVKTHPDKLWVDLMEGGFAANGYDGVPFYGTTHPQRGGGTQSNLLTDALDTDSFNEAVELLQGMEDFAGEPIDAAGMGGQMVLCVPPALRATAKGIVEAERNASGGSNINFQAAKVRVIPRLSSAAKWYLHYQVPAGRPFLLQNRLEPEFTMRMNPDDPVVFELDEYRYGARRRYNVGYQWWELTVGSTGVD